MKLITEEVLDCNFIVESVGGKKSMFIEGVFLQGNKVNRNKRLYQTNILAREVGRYNNEYIKAGRALGELGHPDGPTVNLDRVSHKIVSLKQEGDNFIGKAKILNTPMGQIAQSLVNEGVTLGVSSRGAGSLREDRRGYKLVGEDFYLSTAADIVADPSAPDAFVQGIMEGKEWVMANGAFSEENASQTRQYINRATRENTLQESRIQAYAQWMDRVSKFN